MARRCRAYSDEDVIKLSQEVTSMRQLLIKLGLKPVGGNYDNMRRILQRLGIEALHWKGKGWSKDLQLKNWSEYTKATSLKPHLISLRGHACECCSLNEWLGEIIKVEIHHKDGDRTNNTLSNLQLLCPNCHSFTVTWRNNKRERAETIINAPKVTLD